MKMNKILLGLTAVIGIAANAQTSAVVTHYGTIVDGCKWQSPLTVNMGEVQIGEVPEKKENISIFCTYGTTYTVKPQEDVTVYTGGTEELSITLWNTDGSQITAAAPITNTANNGVFGETLEITYRVNGTSNVNFGKGSVVTAGQVYSVSVPLIVEF